MFGLLFCLFFVIVAVSSLIPDEGVHVKIPVWRK